MDGFLTTAFLKSFPENVRKALFDEENNYYDLYRAIKKSLLIVGADGESLYDLLESLSDKDPEFGKSLSSLEAAGKIKARTSEDLIPDSFENIKIRKSILKSLASAYTQPADVVFHSIIEDPHWKNELMKVGYKPLVEDNDLLTAKVRHLFKEKSLPLNIGDTFNWARFLSNFVHPFKHIRIKDPYLYKNIHSIDLTGMIKALTRFSDPEQLTIEIISDLHADSNSRVEETIERIRKMIDIPKYKGCLKLYTQRGSASPVFHSREIWTDFWVLNAERGFDFLKLEKGQGKVIKENKLFLTGRYSSEYSAWHQIKDNWDNYLQSSKKVKDLVQFN
ncbi:MAG: hypothetical protein JJ953_11815 [Gracilimonas sp.]|uniref:hypothetical protein n=1 Tax=Gracilimonas sp. TaxID=1974203 RepID=UPI001B2A3911|nr:hypothetical protein [Gracilimonas sp.]MBO6586785.1 hypothetical protein [Gracilimonas sp.]MBO6615442.1 hypothetical protein [Gracilimonas sp.]